MKRFIILFMLVFTIQIGFAQVYNDSDLVGKWTIVKTEEFVDNELTDSNIEKVNEDCQDYVHFQSSGKFVANEFRSDCTKRDEDTGTWKIDGNKMLLTENEESIYLSFITFTSDSLVLSAKEKKDDKEIEFRITFKRFYEVKKTTSLQSEPPITFSNVITSVEGKRWKYTENTNIFYFTLESNGRISSKDPYMVGISPNSWKQTGNKVIIHLNDKYVTYTGTLINASIIKGTAENITGKTWDFTLELY